MEYFHALKFPIFEEKWAKVMTPVYRRLNFSEVTDLTGNAMNISQVGTVLMFVLATSHKR